MGVLEPHPWQTFVRLLKTHFFCDGVVMVLRWPSHGDKGTVTTTDDIACTSLIKNGLTRVQPDEGIPTGKVFTLNAAQLSPSTGKETTNSSISQVLGADIDSPDGQAKIQLRCIRLSGQPAFIETEKVLLAQLVPRLTQAALILTTLSVLRLEHDQLDDICQELEIGKFDVDNKLKIFGANSYATQILQTRDGLFNKNGTLHCIDQSAQTTLVKMVQETISSSSEEPPHFNPRIFYLRRPSTNKNSPKGNYWSVVFRRSLGRPITDHMTSPVAHIMVKNASYKPSITQRMLEEVFDLTPAEANIAQRLTDGQTLYEAAEASGVSRNTARVQLTAIFSKTQTNRQAQLVSVVLGRLNSGWTIPNSMGLSDEDDLDSGLK